MNAGKVIAIDFDGTLFEECWPDIGNPIWPVINAAKQEQHDGAELILWTTREDERLQEAVSACRAVGLEFDAVNANTETMKEAWGNDPRKIGATEYWDDRTVNVQSLIHKDVNADEIIKALRICADKSKNLEECHTGQADCPFGNTIMDCTERLNHASADMIESLQVQLAESQRREQAAVEDIEKMMRICEKGACHFCANGDCTESPFCSPKWRGPRDGKGKAE